MKRGFKVMRRAVMALFLREIKTRFGKYQLGYAWALIEPASTVLVMLVVFSALGSHGMPGISLAAFLITGVVVNSLFVEITNRSIKAMEANSALFNYRPIKPVDTVISRTVLELLIHVAVYIFLIGVVVYFGDPFALHDLPLLLSVFLLMALFSFGVGVIYMLITDLYGEADKVLPLISRPLFFISGVFFSIQIVPTEYHFLLVWNPIFHGIELARESIAPDYRVPEANLAYLAFCSLVVVTMSLVFYRRREKKMRLR
jgi:capsular polysaccharide transport system permease protein